MDDRTRILEIDAVVEIDDALVRRQRLLTGMQFPMGDPAKGGTQFRMNRPSGLDYWTAVMAPAAP